MKNIKKILLVVFVGLLFGCRRETSLELEREEKFTLNYGLFESFLHSEICLPFFITPSQTWSPPLCKTILRMLRQLQEEP